MNVRLATIIIVSALVLREAWLFLPEDYQTFDPFPFYDIQITKQTYMSYFCYYGSNLLFVFAFYILVDRLKWFFHIWFLLQFIEVIDYYYTYNTAWFSLNGYGIGITAIKIITLTLTIIVQCFHSFYYKQNQQI